MMENFIINFFLPFCTCFGFLFSLAFCCVLFEKLSRELSEIGKRISERKKKK